MRARVEQLQICFLFCFDRFMLLLGPVLVLLASGLICCIIYIYYSYVLPYYSKTMWSFAWMGNNCLGNFLLINMLFNYVSCVTTNPGSHDSSLYARLCKEAREMGTLAVDADGSDEDDMGDLFDKEELRRQARTID